MLLRLLSWILLVVPLVCLRFHHVFVDADADFESVRVRLTSDNSGKRGDPKEKYFRNFVHVDEKTDRMLTFGRRRISVSKNIHRTPEMTANHRNQSFHPHYDGRFADRQLNYEDKKAHLVALVQTYLSTMADLGAETWLMHGTLLGWWWNRKILPWDSDIDVQMTVDTLSFLASYYNMSVFHYHLPHIPEGRDYLFEINPGFATEGPFDQLNMIDARWIDTETGLFIDITTVRPNETARALGVGGALKCKDRHSYLEQDLFPLRDSVFEATPVKIPFSYRYLLQEEYGKESLTKTEFEKHQWNATTMEWEPLKFVPIYSWTQTQLSLEVDNPAAFVLVPYLEDVLVDYPRHDVCLRIVAPTRKAVSAGISHPPKSVPGVGGGAGDSGTITYDTVR